VATRNAFSDEELEQLRGFPEINRAELIWCFTLTPADEMFVRKFRGQGNVLGVPSLWMAAGGKPAVASPRSLAARLAGASRRGARRATAGRSPASSCGSRTGRSCYPGGA